jgi:hypothetical protein
MRVANGSARRSVQSRISFEGNNTFGEWAGPNYVVYSYGHHWPLFAYVDGTWYENVDKFSRTTSKHSGQLRPIADTEKVTKDELLDLLGL